MDHVNAPTPPLFYVGFKYLGDSEEKRFLALCNGAIPRKGEVVCPEAGSKFVVVHAVFYQMDSTDQIGGPLGVTPVATPCVILREMTDDEREEFAFGRWSLRDDGNASTS